MSTQHKTTTRRDRETTAGMERVTFRETESQLERVDALVERGEYANRSEAIREAIGQLVASETGRDSE
ncbi:ribbon-helix-helix domain-containing protein [Natrinema sp. CBA1119]|uniref:ribbon-helix-helix domain-containing protein n=1 Tax=Natrinema sp. CBA1119 TaxID=1608465 RepID=UPI0020D27361|nr:ribbon-helix-helix domain-containing protein [Natrinema sp. CBA1119]